MKKILFSLIIVAVFFLACTGKEEKNKEIIKIAVFIPGIIAGAPTYEMLEAGAKKAVAENPVLDLTIIEAGYNQGEWESKMTVLASTKSYQYIVTSNPAMPEICERVSANYPNQKFIILDAFLEGNNNIYTFAFNSFQQAFLVGAMGALVTKSDMPGANRELKVGLIAAQEYPLMNNIIKKGVEAGLAYVDKNISLDFRIVGNWYDAFKGAELAAGMYESGVDVILAIAGGAGQGVLSTAREKGKYVLWFDNNGYSLSEGQVVGCAAIAMDRVAYEVITKIGDGTLSFGKAELAGIKEGYVYFVHDDPIFENKVPEDLRQQIIEISEKIAAGEIDPEA